MGVIKKFLYELLLILDVVFFGTHNGERLHRSRFANPSELKSIVNSSPAGTAILLGIGSFGHILKVSPTQARPELGNFMAVAPTRGGKGLLAVSQLLSWPHSVIVNDIKGELYAQTAGFRARRGPVFVLDPRGVGHRFDPLSGKQTEFELLSAATNLLHRPEDGEGAIFTERATGMLTQIFLSARLEGYPPLPYVRALMRLGLLSAAERLQFVSPELSTQFLDGPIGETNFQDRFLLSSWSSLSARMRLLLTAEAVRSFSGSDFEVAQIMRSEKPVTVYLRWPEESLLSLSPLIRLVWGSIIDGLISTYDSTSGRNCYPVLLLVDEAGRTAIPSLADHATTVAGRGITLWVAIQSLSQLDGVYGSKRAKVLRDNMESQIYYRPSDLETAKYLEERLGRRSDFAHSQTSREGEDVAQGLSEQAVPLMTAQEIMQMGDTEVIGFHRRLPPFKARRMDWRALPILKSRRSLPAPEVSPLPDLAVAAFQEIEKPEPLGFVDPDLDRN